MRMRMVGANEKGAATSAPFHSTPRGVRRSVAEAAVHFRALDVDAHVVVDGALGRNLGQFERLLNAVEVPREFLAARDYLHDLAVLDVDILGAGGDDDRAVGEGSLGRLAVQVAESQRRGRQA